MCPGLRVPHVRLVQELPDYVQEGLEVHYASEYDDVYKVAFEASTEEAPAATA